MSLQLSPHQLYGVKQAHWASRAVYNPNKLEQAARVIQQQPVVIKKRSYLSRIVADLKGPEDPSKKRKIELVSCDTRQVSPSKRVVIVKKPKSAVISKPKGRVTPSPPPFVGVKRASQRARKLLSPSKKALVYPMRAPLTSPLPVVGKSQSYFDFGSVSDEKALASIPQKLESDADAFPFRLHALLEEAENNGYSHVISWLPHGRSFIINNAKLFESIIMSKYFGPAFKEKLRLRGFNKYYVEGVGQMFTAYYHELFLRGRRDLCAGIVIQSRPQVRSKEPNFYVMPPLDDTAREKLTEIQESMRGITAMKSA